MPKRSIRLSEDLDSKLKEVAAARGFQSSSDLIRDAITQVVMGRDDVTELEETEARIAASLDRFAKEIRSVRRVQQAEFAFLDTLVKVLLTCIPEPGDSVYEQAKARAIARYGQFLKSVGKAMVGDSQGTLADLVSPNAE